MSKNISIKEGGTGRGFTARRLETALEGGGSCLWVPKDEVKRVTKSVDENGTYEAADEGVYGYSELHVNVKGTGSATGKGPDGNEYTVTVDDLGELTETKVPSSIKVTTPPTFVGPYGDGAIIGFEGIEVTAYDAEGNSMGAVPFSELVFPVTIARYDPDAEIKTEYPDYQTSGSVTITSLSNIADAIDAFLNKCAANRGEERHDNIDWKGELAQYAGKAAETVIDAGYLINIVAGTFDVVVFECGVGDTINLGTNNAIIYFTIGCGSYTPQFDSYFGIYSIQSRTISRASLFMGEKLDSSYYQVSNLNATTTGGVPIPVQWPRPGDGKILSDTFDITVVDVSPSTNDDESGNGWTL